MKCETPNSNSKLQFVCDKLKTVSDQKNGTIAIFLPIINFYKIN